MRLQDYDTSQRFKATVASSRRINPEAAPGEVREIVLVVDQPDLQPSPGQSIGVLAPGQKEFGQEHHFRLYTVADLPAISGTSVQISICVRRCSYIDEYSGELHRGVASNYLCDLRTGDALTVAGPYGPAFDVPEDHEANLILIGAGTGIAPFRAFVKHLYQELPEFQGHVRLFHGAHTGLELLYMNEKQNDFSQYYDRDTFVAIAALSQRPHWSDQIDWWGAMESRAEEIWNLLSDAHTCIYLAGLESIRDELDGVFAKVAGSEEKWARRKAELESDNRWIELLY